MQERPFGNLLKTLRKEKHLSQQALAERMGVHRNTIYNWEQGVYLPDSKGMVLELAWQLGLDELATRQLLEASLTTISSYWNVPFARNPFFTGREQILEALHAQLGASRTAALTQPYALHGLGGIGKTQVAVEYAYRSRATYEAVLWVEAETRTTLTSGFVALAELLELPERSEEDQRKVVASVLRWLGQHQNWLLVFDNVEDLALLKPFLPASGQGALLITTRLRALEAVAQSIELPPMSREEGLAFLLARARRQPGGELSPVSNSHEHAAAQEIVAAMDGLPLALEQAGAFIDTTRCSLSDYWRLFQSSQIRLLDRQDTASGHPLSASKTFALAFERVEQQNPAAAEILTVCAFLAPDSIPEALFLEGAPQSESTFEALAADPQIFEDALKTLLAYSLLQRDPAARTLTIHRLVQVVLRERLSEEVQRAWIRRIIDALNNLFPVDEATQGDYWQAGKRLLSHALAALAFSQQWEQDEVQSLSLRCHVAMFLCKRAQYAEAEAHFVSCVRVGEALLGSQHLLVAEALYGQAEACREQGKYAEAEPLFLRSLHIQEQNAGVEHPLIVQLLTNLSLLYWQQGKHEQAESLYQRALRMGEQILGAEHPRLVAPLNNLGILYSQQGKHEQAEALYQRALQILEHAQGPEHPHVASLLTNLGVLCKERRNYEQAETFYLRALNIRERVLSPDHPLVAYPLHGLADIAKKQGNYEQAETFYQRALSVREQALGPEHPLVAQLLINLAELYKERGSYEQAASLYQRALEIFERALGPRHPDVAESFHSLAHFYQLQQRNEEALSFYQRALTIREEMLGPAHPKTQETRAAYDTLLQSMTEDQQSHEHSLLAAKEEL